MEKKSCPLWGDVETAPVSCAGAGCAWWNGSAGSCALTAGPDRMAQLDETLAQVHEALTQLDKTVDDGVQKIVDALDIIAQGVGG